jgi:hypothetical protein
MSAWRHEGSLTPRGKINLLTYLSGPRVDEDRQTGCCRMCGFTGQLQLPGDSPTADSDYDEPRYAQRVRPVSGRFETATFERSDTRRPP